jgi:hypothetical protein
MDVRSNDGQRAFAAALLAIALMVPAAVSIGSGPADAAVFPKIVEGYVLDPLGGPVEGANVTVRSYDNATLKGTLYYDSSESDGFYTVTFEGSQWNPNYTLEVTAVLGADSAQNSTLADSTPLQSLNVTLPVPIEVVVDVVPGWSMFSVPVVNGGYRASTLGLPLGDVVVRWDSGNGTYDKTYIIGVSPPTYDFAIVESHGYWVYASVARSLTLAGDAPLETQNRSVDVVPGGGWALVSLASLSTDWMASDLPGMYAPAGAVTAVAWYDTSTGTYKTYIPGLPFTDFPLAPGRAYWMYCTQDGWMSYDP